MHPPNPGIRLLVVWRILVRAQRPPTHSQLSRPAALCRYAGVAENQCGRGEDGLPTARPGDGAAAASGKRYSNLLRRRNHMIGFAWAAIKYSSAHALRNIHEARRGRQ